MNAEQTHRMRHDQGFIAALDQSGGSTPKALTHYGVPETAYASEDEMYALIHEMRTRIIKSTAFNAEFILGAILFENTMRRSVDGVASADYLWKHKRIVPFLKIDQGLAELNDGVQCMKPILHLGQLLEEARGKNIFGTKMRSLIQEANPQGIAALVEQQFALAQQISAAGLVPIIEPEIDIHSPSKQEAEQILKKEINKQLGELQKDILIMFKFSIPTEADFYRDLMSDPRVLRIVALSGGYSQAEANALLAQNHGLIASFSRALTEGLSIQQNDEAFDAALKKSITAIYTASIT